MLACALLFLFAIQRSPSAPQIQCMPIQYGMELHALDSECLVVIMYTNFISMTGTQYAENNLRENLNRLNQYNKVEGALATFSTLNNFVLRFRFKILGFVG